MPLLLYLHLILALVALGLVLAALAAPKRPGAHRILGRLAASALVLTAVTSFGLPAFGHFSALHILSTVTLLSVPYAVWLVRQGKVAAHRRIMLMNAGGLLVAGIFAALLPGRALHGVLFG
nr:DUF2306 domain-containing protein [uncultured Roseococcus sp.]